MESGAQEPIRQKRSPKDFIFGKVIGEGSFSTVYLAKDIHTNKEWAIKVCDKRHIIKEQKIEYVKREKEVLNMLVGANHSFVRLFCTFQDVERLYFVITYAKNGELLPHINKVGSFDIDCSKFYSAEILRGLEYLHGLGIIHRDLKPENILLDEKMHVLITDFGSSKILNEHPEAPEIQRSCERRNSFVGTAQYVSPELLADKSSSRASDLWALGCIIYQMVAGLPPFRDHGEYQIFQKIVAVNYEVPEGFCELARDLIEKLLIKEPNKRLGATDQIGAGYPTIRGHPFFHNVIFETLHQQTPPVIYPYLPGTSENEELRSHYRVPDNLTPGLDDKQLTRLLGLGIADPSDDDEDKETVSPSPQQQQQQQQLENHQEGVQHKQLQRLRLKEPANKSDVAADRDQEDMAKRLKQQKEENPFDRFVEGNLIIKQGFVYKRKGLFSRKRMLLLTTGPHLYYVDAASMVLKGEIPWSKELRVEPKNFRIFFVHTPNRTYYLDDPERFALEWCQAIEDMRVDCYDVKKTS